MRESTTGITSGFGSSKRVAMFAILVFMSMALSFIEVPLFPGVDWLLYDPSGVVAAFSAILYGPWHGAAIAVLSWIPHLISHPLGALMNIAATASMALVLGFVYRSQTGGRSLLNLSLGVVAATCCATAVAICLNFVVTPLYLSATYEEVLALVVPYLLPYNVAKAFLNTIVAAAAAVKLRAFLDDALTKPEPDRLP